MPCGASGGREVKHTGDGIMSVLRVDCRGGSLRYSDPACAGAARASERRGPGQVRIGAAAGEPVENHLDLFGSTVQLAARLCSHAEPEQSLVSNAVAELCIGKGLTFQDLGEVSLKGFDRPVRVTPFNSRGTEAIICAPASAATLGTAATRPERRIRRT